MSAPVSQPARRTLRPYPGLRAFERTEARIFFGRGQQVDQLLSRLKQHHFLAVLGTSGSGKSSLMKAGVLPALEKGYMGEVGARWAIAEMKPGDQPFLHLAEGLLADKSFAAAWQHDAEAAKAAILAAELRRGARSLHEIWAGTPLAAGTRLLLLVDQFEEMFRYREREENQAAAFVALLLEACQHPDIYVAITMRSDFLGAAAAFHGLPEVINSGLYLTPRLTRDQLHEAITLPAQLFGGAVDEALANHLQNEAGNDPDQLPLLQHALMRMWDSGEDKSLTLARYQGMNGLRGVLDEHAEQAWAELNADQQTICEAMFRALTERSRDGQYIRRPVKVQAIMDLLDVDLATISSVVDAFRQAGRNFLMPPPQVALVAETMLDISHESLIRHWQRLKDWVTAESEKVIMYQRLLDAAQRHAAGKSELWHGTDLALALEWQEKTQPSAAWAMRYFSSAKGEAEQLADNDAFILSTIFLTASDVAQRQLQQAAEANRKSQLKRARRQLSFTLVGLVIALTAAVWGWGERNHALIETAKATKAEKDALLEAKKASEQRERAKQAEQTAHIETENAKKQSTRAVAAETTARAEAEKAVLESKRAFAAESKAVAAAKNAIAQTEIAQASEEMAIDEFIKAKKAEDSTRRLSEATIQNLFRQAPQIAIDYITRIHKSENNAILHLILLPALENAGNISTDQKHLWQKKIKNISDADLAQLVALLFNETNQSISLIDDKLKDLSKNVEIWKTSRIQAYKAKLEKNPKDATALGEYASALELYTEDYNLAENLYEQALAADPKHAANLRNFTNFMVYIRKDYPRAERLYEQAITADPNNGNVLGNFARFMKNIRKDYPRAEKLYEQAIAADPKNVNNLGNFAIFMDDIRKDYPRAEKLYEQVIAADPTNARNLGNFAIFMKDVRKDYPRAEKLYEQAIAADPKNADNLGNFAIFMNDIRKDYPRADKLYEQAIAAAPKNANILGNFAIFMKDVRKDYPRAEKLYAQALAADPKHANNAINFAQLKLIRGDLTGGKTLITQSFANNEVADGIKLEGWFYRLAHFPNEYPEAKSELLALLKQDARDEGWDFSGNIERAEKDGHPNVPMLKAFAEVILNKAKFETLEPWHK